MLVRIGEQPLLGVAIAGQAMILLVGGRMVLDGALTVGQLTAFVLFLSTFFAPIQQLVNLYNTYQKGQAAMTKLADLLATEPLTAERPDAIAITDLSGNALFSGIVDVEVTKKGHDHDPIRR